MKDLPKSSELDELELDVPLRLYLVSNGLDETLDSLENV